MKKTYLDYLDACGEQGRIGSIIDAAIEHGAFDPTSFTVAYDEKEQVTVVSVRIVIEGSEILLE